MKKVAFEIVLLNGLYVGLSFLLYGLTALTNSPEALSQFKAHQWYPLIAIIIVNLWTYFPVLMVIAAVAYFLKKPTKKGYSEALLFPASLILVGGALSFTSLDQRSEGNMFFALFPAAGALLISGLINSVIKRVRH